MRSTFSSIFLLLLDALAQLLACESIYIAPCERAGESDQVFIGTVTEERRKSGTFLFQIDEAIKGIQSRTKEIEINAPPCDGIYSMGERYLIVVSKGFALGERFEEATRSIDFFHALSRGERFSVIQGRIAENTDDFMVRYDLDEEKRPALSGVEVIASKRGKKYDALSDSSGWYSIRVPEGG